MAKEDAATAAADYRGHKGYGEYGGAPRKALGLEDAIAGANERLAPLEAGLKVFVTYDPDGPFFAAAFSIKGRALDRMAQPMALVVVVALAACLMEHYRRDIGWTVLEGDTAKDLSSHIFAMEEFVGTALTFLLVYRLARSAVRYYEARGKAGAMIALVRAVAQCAIGYMGEIPHHRDRVIRFSMALPVATMYHLRKNKPVRGDWGNRAHLAGVLTDEEFEHMLGREHQALWVLDVMRQSIVKVLGTKRDSMYTDEARAAMLKEMMAALNDLGFAFGGMERIDGTPLPFVYLAHLRSFLLVYLISLPIAGALVWGWYTLPISLICAFCFLGIEAAASDCERPFSPSPNHLMLERFCIAAFANVIQIWQGVSLQHDLSEREQEAARHATTFQTEDWQAPVPSSAEPAAANEMGVALPYADLLSAADAGAAP